MSATRIILRRVWMEEKKLGSKLTWREWLKRRVKP